MQIRNTNKNIKNNINFKGFPPTKTELAIRAKINEIIKLSDHTLIKSEKIINNLKVINKKYDVIINEKGLSIIEHTPNNQKSSIEKITTFTLKDKKIVVNYKKKWI